MGSFLYSFKIGNIFKTAAISLAFGSLAACATVETAVQPVADNSDKVVYLTYDDGPDPRFTPALLKVLDKHDVKATFFMNGVKIGWKPELARQVFDAGHIVGNHGFPHFHASVLEHDEIKFFIEKTDKLIKEVTGQDEIIYRAPFGDMAPSNIQYLCEAGRDSASYDMIGYDWDEQNPDEIVKNIMSTLVPGGVILMHDSSERLEDDRMGTVEATNRLIPLLRKKGYRFATVPPKHLWRLKDGDCDPYSGDKQAD